MKDIRSKGERYFFEEKMMERNESSNILFNFRFLSCISEFISGNISIYLSFQLIKSKKPIKESIYDHKTLHPLSKEANERYQEQGRTLFLRRKNDGEKRKFEYIIQLSIFIMHFRIYFWKYFHLSIISIDQI